MEEYPAFIGSQRIDLFLSPFLLLRGILISLIAEKM